MVTKKLVKKTETIEIRTPESITVMLNTVAKQALVTPSQVAAVILALSMYKYKDDSRQG